MAYVKNSVSFLEFWISYTFGMHEKRQQTDIILSWLLFYHSIWMWAACFEWQSWSRSTEKLLRWTRWLITSDWKRRTSTEYKTYRRWWIKKITQILIRCWYFLHFFCLEIGGQVSNGTTKTKSTAFCNNGFVFTTSTRRKLNERWNWNSSDEIQCANVHQSQSSEMRTKFQNALNCKHVGNFSTEWYKNGVKHLV